MCSAGTSTTCNAAVSQLFVVSFFLLASLLLGRSIGNGTHPLPARQLQLSVAMSFRRPTTRDAPPLAGPVPFHWGSLAGAQHFCSAGITVGYRPHGVKIAVEHPVVPDGEPWPGEPSNRGQMQQEATQPKNLPPRQLGTNELARGKC